MNFPKTVTHVNEWCHPFAEYLVQQQINQTGVLGLTSLKFVRNEIKQNIQVYKRIKYQCGLYYCKIFKLTVQAFVTQWHHQGWIR